MSFASWERGQYRTQASDQSLQNLVNTGANWVALIVTVYQETIASTSITRDTQQTASDDDLFHAITTIHESGLNVMLKPHLDLSLDAAHWRGNIGEAFTTEIDWDAWFAAYTSVIVHYANLAQTANVEQLCVGTELVGTSSQEGRWRNVISEVKKVFRKPLVYACNHGEESDIHWWDSLDFIGVDAYYSLTEQDNPPVPKLKEAWRSNRYIATLEQLAQTYQKQIIFTEIGYRSTLGINKEPWNWQQTAQINLEEQANCYQAVLETFLEKTWMNGIYWWHWDPDPNKGGIEDDGYTCYKKPAENVLKSFFLTARSSPG